MTNKTTSAIGIKVDNDGPSSIMTTQTKQGDFYIELKAKNKWINDLLEANAFMLSAMRENGLSVPQSVIDAEIPPEEREINKQ